MRRWVLSWWFVFACTSNGPPKSKDDAFLTRPLPAATLPKIATTNVGFRQPYRFTTDWLTHDIPSWGAALAPYKDKPGVRYLEIGVFEGRSLFWIMENILTDPSSKATAIEPMLNASASQLLRANLALSPDAGRIEMIEGFSQIEMRKLPLGTYDFIYIDGSHMAPDVLEDAVLAWRLVKPGGLIIFDDYAWHRDQPPAQRPDVAIATFFRFFEAHLEVVHNEYQLIVRRKRGDAAAAP